MKPPGTKWPLCRSRPRAGTAKVARRALEVRIAASIPNVDAATTQALVQKAHQVCPCSNATRGNIKVEVAAS